MDPDVALARLIAAAVKGEAVEMMNFAEVLQDWLNKGGFPPERLDSRDSMVVVRNIQSGVYDDDLGHLVTAVYRRARKLAPNLTGASTECEDEK